METWLTKSWSSHRGWARARLTASSGSVSPGAVMMARWQPLSRRRRARARVSRPAMAGTPDGVLSHTVSGQAWQNLRFNGTLVGETGINAAVCGNWGVPVVLVTGDRAVCREARELLGDALTTVEVKEGLGRFSARMKPPARARELIEEGARQALSDLSAVAPYDPGRPCEIEIEFTTPDRLQEYANRKGVEVTGASSLVVRGDDWWTAWSNFFF